MSITARSVSIQNSSRTISLILSGGRNRSTRCMKHIVTVQSRHLISGLETACIQEHVVIDIKNAIKGPINDRIAFYNSLIAQHRWKVMKHCTHVIAAFEEAVYDEKKKNMDVRLDDGEMNVDSLDSTEYSTESIQDEIMYIAA